MDWYHVYEWGVHRSTDIRGKSQRAQPVIQVNLGRLGITIPVRRKRGK